MPHEVVHGCRIYIGDNRLIMPTLPHSSVHCVVTSPPYYNQRDYGHAGQIGLEKTPQEYIDQLVKLFREVRLVMRRDATLWLNLGDKYIDGQLLGMPWRVALALQADGWILRSDIIWHRVNAMPGSQHDRPSCNHEYMFLLAREKNYYYDDVAIREPTTDASGDRTKRTVWPVPVASEKEGHFAVFPPALVLPCILAGTSEHGCCAACGMPWQRDVERARVATRPGLETKATGDSAKEGNRDPQRHVTEIRTLGWRQGCKCATQERKPAIVLDPFGGSGTTACVAVANGRRAVLCELNPMYVEIAKRKLAKAIRRRGFVI